MTQTNKAPNANDIFDQALDKCFSYLNTERRAKMPFILTLYSTGPGSFSYIIDCKPSGRGWRDAGDAIDIPVGVRDRLYDALKTGVRCLTNSAPGTYEIKMADGTTRMPSEKPPDTLESFIFSIHSNGAYQFWNLPAKRWPHDHLQKIGNFIGSVIGSAKRLEKKRNPPQHPLPVFLESKTMARHTVQTDQTNNGKKSSMFDTVKAQLPLPDQELLDRLTVGTKVLCLREGKRHMTVMTVKRVHASYNCCIEVFLDPGYYPSDCLKFVVGKSPPARSAAFPTTRKKADGVIDPQELTLKLVASEHGVAGFIWTGYPYGKDGYSPYAFLQ
jgi:hypothetical protein